MGILAKHERKVLKEKINRKSEDEQSAKSEKRKKAKSVAYIIIIILALSALGYLSITGFFVEKTDYQKFAVCLSGKNVSLYTGDGCPLCEKQIGDFGKYASLLKQVDCSHENCSYLGVSAYPVWIINNISYIGRQPLDIISVLSGCRL